MKLKAIPVPRNEGEILYNLFVERFRIYKVRSEDKIVAVRKDRKEEYFPLYKQEVIRELHNMYFKQFRQLPKQRMLESVWMLIDAVSSKCKDETEIVSLIYQNGDTVYYNLQGSPFCISFDVDYRHQSKITNSVRLRKKKACSVLFPWNETKTTPYLREDEVTFYEEAKRTQPVCERKELNAEKEKYLPKLNRSTNTFFRRLRELFPVDEQQLMLLAVYIISCFTPNLNHPLLMITGEKGAAKSTMARMIGKIIDPISNDLVALPDTADRAAVILHDNYYTAFDNVSFISQEMSDLFCLAVTGGTYKKRMLYSNSNVIKLDIHRPVAITGIDMNLNKPDLMDRAIVFRLDRLSEEKRKTERTLFGCLEDELMSIQGYIFSILGAPAERDRLEEQMKSMTLPRLADFAKFGYVIGEKMCKDGGKLFLDQYRQNIASASDIVIDCNILLSTLRRFLDGKPKWKGTANELLTELSKTFFRSSVSRSLPKGFPTTANVLTRKLGTVQSDIRAIGYDMETGRGVDRYIRFTKRGE